MTTEKVREKQTVEAPHKKGVYEKYIKRPVDFILSLVALIVFSPILLIVAVLVRIKLGSPVIFKQERPGLNGEIFNMYKFRTMTDERDENGELLPDIIRLTNFGRFLRNSSLDELPELINILKGEMSVIGPRPLLTKYLPLYNDKQRRRHEVRPGMTGYAQSHGRNSMSWEDKFDMDVYYVDHISFLGDLKIIMDTVLSVIRREGIDSSNSSDVTIEEFKGTK